MRLDDKVALIGGAGQGMGRAMAWLFAQEGAKVGVMARRMEIVAETVQRVREADGVALGIRGDSTVEADVMRAMQLVVETFGGLDIVVCNTGGPFELDRQFDRVDDEYWERAMSLHLKTIVYLARHARPLLRQRGGGSIVTIAASASVRQDPEPSYGAGKSGVIGLSLSLARKFYGDNIRVNCVAPGLVGSPLADGSVRPVTGTIARTGRPEDVAYAALYFASAESSWVTGQVLVVDGGVDVGTRGLWDLER